MAIAFDGTRVPNKLERMPCGGIPEFDDGSGCSYRCDFCGATIGSISQSKRCIDINNDEEYRKREWKMLGGKS